MSFLLLAWVALGCRQSMSPQARSTPSAEREWNNTLAVVVTPDGYVDYDLLEARRESLDNYVAFLGDEVFWAGRLTRDFHARYLNAYNALVLYQVLERGRPGSVLDPRRLLPVPGAAFFVETQFKVGFDWLSLSEIEHERVRQKELDIRDHAALNCASMSCPPMRNEVYRMRPALLQEQLDDQMTRWVMDDARGVRIEGGEAVFSPIFDWFAHDFSFWTAGLDLCSIAARYAREDKQAALEALALEGCPHRFFTYDWSLNDASARP